MHQIPITRYHIDELKMVESNDSLFFSNQKYYYVTWELEGGS